MYIISIRPMQPCWVGSCRGNGCGPSVCVYVCSCVLVAVLLCRTCVQGQGSLFCYHSLVMLGCLHLQEHPTSMGELHSFCVLCDGSCQWRPVSQSGSGSFCLSEPRPSWHCLGRVVGRTDGSRGAFVTCGYMLWKVAVGNGNVIRSVCDSVCAVFRFGFLKKIKW